MTAEKFTAGSYTRQNAPQEREEEGFCDRVTVTEGTTPPSRYRPDGADSVHRDSVREYVPHDTNHAPYESAKRRNAPQASAPPSGGPIDLGKVTAKQHKMLADRSRKGKKKVG